MCRVFTRSTSGGGSAAASRISRQCRGCASRSAAIHQAGAL